MVKFIMCCLFPLLLFGQEEIVILRLEPFVESNQLIYPGQTFKVGYRYIFNNYFTLSKEVVPLLEAKGFQKVGGSVFKETTEDNLTIVEVSQIVKAMTPGAFTFGPSEIRGRSYIIDSMGNKQTTTEEFSAIAPLVNVVVAPFPEKNKPPSFNGAVGDFTMNLSMLTPEQVTIGDKILLQINITGTGELENIPLPTICCQPGFSGFFRLSDLPPTEKIEGKTKIFVVELKLISDSVKEIPTLEFSFFNPTTVNYGVVHSKPIPLKVIPLKSETPVVPIKTFSEPPQAKAGSIEIHGIFPLEEKDLSNKMFGTWWVLLTIPLGALILYLQMSIKDYLEAKSLEKKNSLELFEEALRARHGSSKFYNKLQRAFLTKLYERGDIKSVNISNDQVPGETGIFLRHIDQIRFSGETGHSVDKVIQDAKILYRSLQQ